MHTTHLAPTIDIAPAGIGVDAHTRPIGVVAGWTVGGILFGLTFPLIGILVASGWGFAPIEAHRSQSVLFIVDLAPLVLGVTGLVLGRAHRNLVAARDAVEHEVRERTAELTATLATLGHTQSRLVQAQKLEAIGSLAAGVAHEINTPIQYVGDNVRFLEGAFNDLMRFQNEVSALAEQVRAGRAAQSALTAFDAALEEADLEFLNAEIPGSVAQALEGIHRVSEIVRALKAFSHPGTGEFEPFDVNRAIETTVAVSKNEWKYVAQLELELDPDLPAVSAIPGPLNQALLVIVVNAAQALAERLEGSPEPPGVITISTASSGDRVRIAITDNGGGIPEAIRSSVFDPFFTTKPVGTGSGQGLAIAHTAVVDQHGGELWFEVDDGVGTTFFIELPLQRPTDPDG